jgi:hypothetical protein
MRIATNQNFTNYQTKSNVNNSPAFKAQFVSTPAAKKQLKENFLHLYNNGDPIFFYKNRDPRTSSNKLFNFNTFYKKFKEMLESTTSNIKGTIKLVESNDGPIIQFITPEKNVYSHVGKRTTGISASNLIYEGNPTINNVISKLADLELNNSNGSYAFSNLSSQITNK